MAKVTGIGGVFFKGPGDAKVLGAWYAEHLGISFEAWGGAILQWSDDHAGDGGCTVWSLAAEDSKWFAPSTSSFMINYRVDDLAEMVRDLKAKGVEIIQGPESHENGAFAWIMDPAGNKVELWEPKAYESSGA